MVKDYNHVRYDKCIKTATTDLVHTMMVGWIEMLKKIAIDSAMSSRTVNQSLQMVDAVFCRGIRVLNEYQSVKARDTYCKKVMMVPYVRPLPFPGGDNAARFSLIALLGRVLQRDASARKLIIAKSEEWKTGDLHMKRAAVYTDLTDGWKARSSPLMREAAIEPPGAPLVIRVLMQLHNDDATMVNPIGAKKGEHKYSVTSGAIVNLPLRMRLSFDYLLLLSLVSAKLLREKGGLLLSLAGRDQSGHVVIADSLIAEFEQLERGIPIMLPNDDDPELAERLCIIEGHFSLVSADWLAAQAFGFTPESTSATMCCGKTHVPFPLLRSSLCCVHPSCN